MVVSGTGILAPCSSILRALTSWSRMVTSTFQAAQQWVGHGGRQQRGLSERLPSTCPKTLAGIFIARTRHTSTLRAPKPRHFHVSAVFQNRTQEQAQRTGTSTFPENFRTGHKGVLGTPGTSAFPSIFQNRVRGILSTPGTLVFPGIFQVFVLSPKLKSLKPQM